MSKVTNRLDNSQIAELAKKQYEQQKQKSKFPANIIHLPSGGKVYAETSTLHTGTIEMRHMTAYDEDILANSSYINEGIIFDKLLEALIITPNIDIDELVSGDKEWLVISARILGYGTEYPVSIIDPKTNNPVTANMDLSKLKAKKFNLTADTNGCFEYKIPNTNNVIKFKYLSAKTAADIGTENISSKFLKLSIFSINGEFDNHVIEEFLKYDFKAIDSRKFRKYIIDSAPGINYNTTAIGENGDTVNATFQFNADLFWF